jgi:hypothetical protein
VQVHDVFLAALAVSLPLALIAGILGACLYRRAKDGNKKQ